MLLDVQQLSVYFGSVHACDGIDLRVDAGELIGIVGPNGSGKTTLLRGICGDVAITRGRVIWQDREITGWRPDRIARHGLMRTFQQSMVFASATVRENLRMAVACGATGRLARRNRTTAVDVPDDPNDMLTFTSLSDVADTLAGALPTGMVRILGIALTLMGSPSLLMLDEPAAGLSIEESDRLSTLLRRLQKGGMALAVVDHDVSFLVPVCQRLVVLDYGKKLTEGAPTTVTQNADVIRVYLGERFRHGKAGPPAAEVHM